MRLDGSVALVTGSSAGIGRASAERLADAGAHVIVHGRDQQRLEAVAHDTAGSALIADLTEEGAVEVLAQAALAVRGRIDVLVACAGLGWSGPYDEICAEEINRLVTLNLLAPLHLVRLLLPPMLARGSGHLVLVGSVAGRTGVAGEAVYAATKAGIDAFAESLRLELHGSGVGVSLIMPGAVDTDFFRARGRPYDRRYPRPVPAEAVAQAIVSAIVEDRPESWQPGWLRLAPLVRALAPTAYRRLSAHFGERVRPRSGGGQG